MFVEIANGSRIDTGFRLIERCARHAVDTKADMLELQRHCAFFFDNQTKSLGMKLGNYIPASMKNQQYETEVAILSGRKLAACSCTCETGSENEGKVACVHVLPILLLFSFLLVEGLAEHILLELAALLSSDQEVLNDVENAGDGLRKKIIILLRAAHEIETSVAYNAKTVKQMLEIFAVGTEPRKKKL